MIQVLPCWMLGCVLFLIGSAAALEAREGDQGVKIQVTTREGHVVDAMLFESEPDQVALKLTGIAEQLAVDVEGVDELRFIDPPKPTPAAEGETIFSVLLDSGDLLTGRLISASESAWTLDALGIGELVVPRDRVVKIECISSDSIALHGPLSLVDWDSDGDGAAAFRVSKRGLASSGPEGRLQRKLPLDEACRVRLRLEWKGVPRFRLVLGVSRGRKLKGSTPVVLEPFGERLVAWHSDKSEISLTPLLSGLERDSSLELVLGVEPEEVIFFDAQGEEYARIERPDKDPGGLTLLNDGASLTLAELSVVRGEVQLEALTDSDVPVFGPEGAVSTDGEEAWSLDQVLSIAGSAEPAPLDLEGLELVRLRYADGRQVTGQFVRVSAEGIVLAPTWFVGEAEPIVCSFAGLEWARFSARKFKARARSSKSYLSTKSGEIGGQLRGLSPDGSILWRPNMTETAAPVEASVVKRIVLNRTSAYFVSSRRYPHRVHFRSGDSFCCKVVRLQGDELTFASPFGGERTVPVESIKFVECNQRAVQRFRELVTEKEKPKNEFFGFGSTTSARTEKSEGFDAKSLKRALALPRKYKHRRFEHLILAESGDFLRTRISGWSDAGIEIPGRTDEARLIPNDRVAAVAWLGEGPEVGDGPAAKTSRARLVLDGRTQFAVEILGVSEVGTKDARLRVRSDALGELEIKYAHIISIDLADDLLTPGTEFDSWVLEPMREPFPPEASADGAEHALLGQPAIATQGKDLEGKDLDLADFRGQVVLLDFWGHW